MTINALVIGCDIPQRFMVSLFFVPAPSHALISLLSYVILGRIYLIKALCSEISTEIIWAF